MSKRLTIEELKKLVTEVRYESICYIGGSDTIDIKKADGKITVKLTSMSNYYDDEYCITQERWDALIDTPI